MKCIFVEQWPLKICNFCQANPRMTLFTGSSRVAEKLALDLKGRIRLEDAGFDWKVLGPDVQEVSYYTLTIYISITLFRCDCNL